MGRGETVLCADFTDKETNDMTTEEIRPGDKLLIVKGISN